MRVLLFENVHRVMQAEQRLVQAGIDHELVPAPREHSADCGMCISLEESVLPRALEVLGRIVVRVVDGEGGGGK